jgi:hypothetical protein
MHCLSPVFSSLLSLSLLLYFVSGHTQDLKDFMRKAGEVSYADVRRDRDGEG